jgi:hypothetical protein
VKPLRSVPEPDALPESAPALTAVSPSRATDPDATRKAQLIFMLIRLAIWAAVAAMLWPRLLASVGWPAGAEWLRHHLWFRWLSAPVLAPLMLLSVFEIRSVGPAGEADAESNPGSSDSAGGMDLTWGLRERAPVRWPVGGHVVEAATWSQHGERRCVATVTLDLASGLAFSARSASLEPAWMRGMAQQAMRAGLRQVARSAGSGATETGAALEFLSQDPIDLRGTSLDGSVVLRANAPEAARALFGDPEVARALDALEQAGRRWQWSLLPTGSPGQSRLCFECPGRVETPELAEAVRALMSAALGRWSPR